MHGVLSAGDGGKWSDSSGNWVTVASDATISGDVILALVLAFNRCSALMKRSEDRVPVRNAQQTGCVRSFRFVAPASLLDRCRTAGLFLTRLAFADLEFRLIEN